MSDTPRTYPAACAFHPLARVVEAEEYERLRVYAGLIAEAAREALHVMEYGNTDEPGEVGRLAAVRWVAAKDGLRAA